jgi:AcrR family transcriptional regulator
MFVLYGEAMPRVTQEHLDARRRQILDAARTCFVQNGFHATSMQDILKASGMSAGAVYRYFPSKEAIIVEIAHQALSEVTRAIDEMAALDQPPPLDLAVEALLSVVLRMERDLDFARVTIQLWSEAVRNPEISRQAIAIITAARGRFAELIRLQQRAGHLPDDVPSEDVAATLASVLPGFILQHVLVGDVQPKTFRNGIHALINSAVARSV